MGSYVMHNCTCGVENREGGTGLAAGGNAGFSEADFWNWVTVQQISSASQEWHGAVHSSLLALAQLLY